MDDALDLKQLEKFFANWHVQKIITSPFLHVNGTKKKNSFKYGIPIEKKADVPLDTIYAVFVRSGLSHTIYFDSVYLNQFIETFAPTVN